MVTKIIPDSTPPHKERLQEQDKAERVARGEAEAPLVPQRPRPAWGGQEPWLGTAHRPALL